MAASQAMEEWKPRYNPWLVAVVVAIAAFMEVLDTSIANVALPHIAGNLGASQDQAMWVLTTYLVANAIVLPITGWISSAVGRKRFFMICIALFAASSLLCGLAPSLPILLLARALQGASGGGLQPMSQAIMADSFPRRLRGAAFALYGVTVLVAPALGPTLGGWITDNYSWRWIFLINLPVGLLALGLIYKLVEDPPFLRRFKPGKMRLDYVGLSLLVLGVAALQIFLDKVASCKIPDSGIRFGRAGVFKRFGRQEIATPPIWGHRKRRARRFFGHAATNLPFFSKVYRGQMDSLPT